jgi:ribosomal protein S18 acetylase RimI-like enzyme
MDNTRYQIRRLDAGEAAVLLAADPQLFDFAVSPRWTAEFLADPRHHIAVALFDGRAVGSATATHYVHPDQPPTLFIIEVAVAAEHQRQGLAKALLEELLHHGRALGCTTAWVGTEVDNTAARTLYRAVGGTQDSEAFVTYTFDLGPGGRTDPP